MPSDHGFQAPVVWLDTARSFFRRFDFTASPIGKIYAVAEEQRASLLRNEAKAVREILAAYEHANRAIQTKLDRVLAKLLKAQEDGTEINQVWLFQQGRLNELLAEVQTQIARFGGHARQITEAHQALNAVLATNGAGALVSAAGVKSGFVLLHTEAFSDIVGYLSDGSPLHDLFSKISPEAVKVSRAAFAKGLATGLNPRVTSRLIRKGVNDGLQMSKNRALTIARNETMRAYRSATLRNYQANPSIVKGWRWLSGRDSRCCVICISQDGSVHPLSEPFASHIACRCSCVPVLSEVLDTNIGTGEEWLSGQDEATQLSVMGGSQERLDMWRDGDASLDSMTEETYSPKWGKGLRIKPMKDLR